MKGAALLIILLGLSASAGYFLGYRRAGLTGATAEQTLLEGEFARSMSGVVLEGSFTTEGSAQTPPRVERYTIEGVDKLAGDHWLFRARLEFGDTDVTLPIPVRVLWAGDTPVVTLTDLGLPGVGTFTARVVFYRDRYAGLWWSPESGGQQFGRILRE
ncbi:MAG TPA: hypothetical protein VLK65_12865 [Vicinamibacteria bacterium]|nr:hypothetical protein [Vicinamibacteria bacterium]